MSLAVMLQVAFTMLRNGRGLETYHTFWLVEFNWVGFVVFLGCSVAALVLALIARSVQLRRERAELQELERLGSKHGHSA